MREARAGHSGRHTVMLSFFRHQPYTPAHDGENATHVRGLGTPGEMISLSFSISSREPIENLKLTASALRGGAGVISNDSVNLYVVGVWRQAGIGVYQSAPTRVAELLLKDDRQHLRDGYTRRGRCCHWRHTLRASRIYSPPEVRLDGHVCTSFAPGETKQIWVSVRIPRDARAGLYDGYVEANSVNSGRGGSRLGLQIEVLPFTLLEAEQDLLLWYKGTLDCNRPQHYLREERFRAQLQDAYDHGFRSLSLNEHEPELLQRAVDIAHDVGFKRNVLLTAIYPERFASVDFKQLTPIYYVSDEMDVRGSYIIRNHVENWRRVKAAGGLTMASLIRQPFARRLSDGGAVGCPPDVLSYFLPENLNYFLAHSEFHELRERGTYYYWHSHMEKPIVHRTLAGLYLWKSKADGIAPYCYQHLPKPPYSPFNDFDEWEPGFHVGAVRRPFKDHMTTYPAKAGSIPTLQWKGMADGIYDLRYMATFQSALVKVARCPVPEAQMFADEVRLRATRFLKRISLKEINVISETDPDPYPGIGPEEYALFREQLARDIVNLNEMVRVHGDIV